MSNATPNDDPLRTDVQFVRGVGPRRAELLQRLELRTAEDLLFNVPRDVLDLSRVIAVGDLEENVAATVRGTVVDRDSRMLSRGRSMTAILLDCEGGYLRGVWFNQPFRLKQFGPGEDVLFSGKPKSRSGRWEISHPHVQKLGDEAEDVRGEVLPRYALTEGLSMPELRRVSRNAVEDYAEFLADALPESMRASHELPSLVAAVRGLHVPATRAEYEASVRRVVFEDLFEFQLGLALRRRAWRTTETAPVLPTSGKVDARIRRLFPFRFTGGQDAAVADITTDLASGRAMHRLLQADVGAGKTAVALYAMLVTVAAGCQAVLMAPTEVLAQQHWSTIEAALGHSRVERLFLTGRLTKARRTEALSKIRSGAAQLIVGTQALIQEDVTFDRLGLAVIDEQHKFGVRQRSSFAAATDAERSVPHVLVMTATPIPRSLCMTQFGDLDVTRIDELPPGRQRVVTSRVATEAARAKVWEFVRGKLDAGRQAYVVCPRIEDGDDGERAIPLGAVAAAETLSAGELGGYRVGLVHGRMKAEEKEAIVDAFRRGAIRVLVSTTVVEVGVDVPNATLMAILHANLFGLSQLHQLRGRIARGTQQGHCLLFTDGEGEEENARLAALESTSDGFVIAEKDFELRGPGDVLGTRQHGQLPLRVADLVRDRELLEETRSAAFELVESATFDAPEFAPLKVRVLERFGALMDLPQSG